MAEPASPQDGTAEATPSVMANSETQVAPGASDSSEAAASKDADDVDGQVAPAPSVRPEATVNSQVTQVWLTSELVRLETTN
jgi:hypothetical protein